MERRRTLVAGLAVAALASGLAVAQTAPPAPAEPAAPAAAPAPPATRPSPLAMARVNLGDAYLSVVYSRPSKRGRDNIFGSKDAKALVPFGEVWRTGANEATEVVVTRDLLVGGKRLPAGNYSLFTVPGADRWTVHFNRALGLWGSRDYDAAKDVLVLEAKPNTLADEVEQFTIALPKKGDGAELVLSWIKTEVRLPVEVAP